LDDDANAFRGAHLGEDVHELALALIAPLAAEDRTHGSERAPLRLVQLGRLGRLRDRLGDDAARHDGARRDARAMTQLERSAAEDGGVRASGGDGAHDAHLRRVWCELVVSEPDPPSARDAFDCPPSARGCLCAAQGEDAAFSFWWLES
jgi:hypothetical protein